ncbi:MAG: metallopeptidase family protein [Myxococcales bacterium]
MVRPLAAATSALLLSCHAPRPGGATAPQREGPTVSRVHLTTPAAPGSAAEPPHREPGHPACPAPAPAASSRADDYLDASEHAFDARNYDLALACAEEALLEDPESPAALHERAADLVALDRLDDARVAFTHALAVDPDDPQILLDAADLYLSHGGNRESDEIALQYARRGQRRARRHHPELLGQLELLEGMALDDLGRPGEALPRLDEALSRDPKDPDARYERGAALFELCRFAEAQGELKRVLEALPDDAYAHHELGLALEQLGDLRGSARELARATELSPKDFPAPLAVSLAEFKAMVKAALDRLPADAKADLGGTPVSVQDLPDVEDLTVDDPPLSPTILGLFRGEPLEADAGAACGEPRAIVLYRRNLLRAVRSQEELETQVKITLLHELGHLRGADDDELRLEGLE